MSVSRMARRVAATTLTVGAVASALALPASADGHHGGRPDRSRVVISAVQADSPGHDDGSNRSLNREWVEITNQGRHSVNLRGWTLRNDEGGRYRFDHVRLGGHATVRVHTGKGHDTRQDVFQDRRDYFWDNRHDTATLRNDSGRVVDRESWGGRRGGGHHDGGHDGGGHHGGGHGRH